MTILAPDGSPAATPTPTPETASAAPVALEARTVGIKDGPLTLRVQCAFDGVELSGDPAGFVKAIDGVLAGCGNLAVRVVEFMLLGGQHGISTRDVVLEVMQAMKGMRYGLEGMMARVQQGLSPIPVVETAAAKPSVLAP